MPVINIERTNPKNGRVEGPHLTSRGYQLVDRSIPSKDRNHVKNATFVKDIREAASLIERGYGIRMACASGKNYIYSGLRIVRA